MKIDGWKAKLLRSIAGCIFIILLMVLWMVDYEILSMQQCIGAGIALGMIVIMWSKEIK